MYDIVFLKIDANKLKDLKNSHITEELHKWFKKAKSFLKVFEKQESRVKNKTYENLFENIKNNLKRL